MSKQRRPTRGSDVERGPSTVSNTPEHATSATSDQDVARQQALVGGSVEPSRSLAATDGGPSRLATVLQLAPRDRAHTDRLAAVVERSALPPERREAILSRLRADQALADDVARHVNGAIGGDSEASRASLSAVLAAAAGGQAASALVEQLPEWFGGVDGAQRAESFCLALASTAPWWWDEEEVEPHPGDYAMEESGC